MLGQIETLLGNFVKKPECPSWRAIATHVGRASAHSLGMEPNQRSGSAFFRYPCTLIEAQVERTPDAIAVICGDESLSYRELNRRANRVAHALQKLGVCADLPVGLCVERSVDGLVGLLGILKAGGGYVPLDPSFPDHRLRLMLDDAQVAIVVAQGHLRRRLHGYGGQICDVERSLSIHGGGRGRESRAPLFSPDQLAYIMYTSGSTGRAKRCGSDTPQSGHLSSCQTCSITRNRSLGSC